MGKIPGIAEKRCIESFRAALGGTPVVSPCTFDFLRGDPTPSRPLGAKLPVDAYFPAYSLVIEYMGEQHSRPNRMMDRWPGRRDQRARYQARRTELLELNGIRLIRVWHTEVINEELIRAKLREVGIGI